ncbi:MAG: methyltransferase domain-containing protein [Parachlamydiales bacterium]
MNDKWNPEQYQKFSQERKQPFYDLVELIEPKMGISILDLGCGTGELTEELHTMFKASYTLGIDSSPSMLEKAEKLVKKGLEFRQADISKFTPDRKFDLVFSNAALQWIPDHVGLFKHLFILVADKGQLAFQIPANNEYPTHVIARELAEEPPFNSYFDGGRPLYALSPESYAQLLVEGDFHKQAVRLQIYPHILESTESVLEWVKGTLLTYYQSRLPPDVFEEFLATYKYRIIAYFGEQRPFFYPFRRILMWGSKG